MNTTNFTNVIAAENEIFFLLENTERNKLFNGSIMIDDIEYINTTDLGYCPIEVLLEKLIPIINSNDEQKSECSFNELIAVYTSKIFHGNPPFKENNCFVFNMKENKIQYVGAVKIKDLDEAIDTSLNMINNFIYN